MFLNDTCLSECLKNRTKTDLLMFFLLFGTGVYLERPALQGVTKETVLPHAHCAEIRRNPGPSRQTGRFSSHRSTWYLIWAFGPWTRVTKAWRLRGCELLHLAHAPNKVGLASSTIPDRQDHDQHSGIFGSVAFPPNYSDCIVGISPNNPRNKPSTQDKKVHYMNSLLLISYYFSFTLCWAF